MIKNGTKNKSKAGQPTVNIAVVEACGIGLIAALGAVVLKHGVSMVGAWRVDLAQIWVYWLPIFGLLGGLISGALIQYMAPHAAGSGIPLTKAALRGVSTPLDLRTVFVKLFGCIASLGTGLALGREGPTVHVAASLSCWFSKLMRTSPTHRTQLIAAGAGAGLAAAFNAPLAGALFVLEELLGNMSGLSAGTTIVACFVAAVTARLVGVHSLDIHFDELFPKATFGPIDIPFVVLLGILSGCLGALFNKSIIGLMTFNRDVLKLPVIATCSLAGLMTGVIIMNLPDVFRNYAGLREMLIQGRVDSETVLLALAAQFLLTVIGYSSGAPGGLFAPSLTLGCCLGHFVGIIEQNLVHSGDIGTMATVGMGALFCSVARVPITSVVIIFEITTDFNVVLPLMISCVISYLVAERLDPGSLYDRLLRFSGINLEEQHQTDMLYGLTARKLMTEKVETLSIDTTFKDSKLFFDEHSHGGYPVVDQLGHLVGMVTRSDILNAEKQLTAPDVPLSKVMSAKPVFVRPDESLAGILHLMDLHKISRLPVLDRDKLVGLITRTNILREETRAMGTRTTSSSNSYLIYQTRSSASGIGRLLVPVDNLEKEVDLLDFAAEMAQAKGYELECLHVITVPSEEDPTTADVSQEAGRTIAARAESVGKSKKIPVHATIRVAHEPGIAITETTLDREIDMMLMGWSNEKDSNESLKSILKATNCQTVLVKSLPNLDEECNFVIPIAPFLDQNRALEIGSLMLSKRPSARVTLYQVTSNEVEATKFEGLFNSFAAKHAGPVERSKIEADSLAKLLTALKAKDGDTTGNTGTTNSVLILAVTRKYLLKSMSKGGSKRELDKFENFGLIVTAG